MKNNDLEIFLTTVPGLEPALHKEIKALGFKFPEINKGGITIKGGWPDVWRANLMVRGASKILVRIGNFRALHLAQLDKRARKFPWADFLDKNRPLRVEATCKKSRIYHHKAAAQRIENALKEEFGAHISADAELTIKVRIQDDMVTLSIDTSGELLHKRGYKEAVNKAPMRENLAALLLRECGFNNIEPVLDPMCGSGTFVLEAAEIAAGLNPGRSRSFTFEKLPSFNAQAWEAMKNQSSPQETDHRCYGFDRDAGAIKMSTANAERANVSSNTAFKQQSISKLEAPDGPSGLIIINPPYGARIGEIKKLLSLYQSLGKTLSAQFSGWRVGIVTNSDKLLKATGLPFKGKPLSFSHGGIPVKLYKTGPLK